MKLVLSLAAAGLLAVLLSPLSLTAKPVNPPVVAPAWTLPDPDGKSVSFAQFTGKVVVVDFWATWCPPCKTEMPGYIELQKKYANDVVFVGISVDGDPSRPAVRAFMKKIGVNYPIVMADDEVQAKFKLNQGYPTTFIIDRAGKIRAKKVGREPKADFEAELLAVINQPSA